MDEEAIIEQLQQMAVENASAAGEAAMGATNPFGFGETPVPLFPRQRAGCDGRLALTRSCQ